MPRLPPPPPQTLYTLGENGNYNPIDGQYVRIDAVENDPPPYTHEPRTVGNEPESNEPQSNQTQGNELSNHEPRNNNQASITRLLNELTGRLFETEIMQFEAQELIRRLERRQTELENERVSDVTADLRSPADYRSATERTILPEHQHLPYRSIFFPVLDVQQPSGSAILGNRSPREWLAAQTEQLHELQESVQRVRQKFTAMNIEINQDATLPPHVGQGNLSGRTRRGPFSPLIIDDTTPALDPIPRRFRRGGTRTPMIWLGNGAAEANRSITRAEIAAVSTSTRTRMIWLGNDAAEELNRSNANAEIAAVSPPVARQRLEEQHGDNDELPAYAPPQRGRELSSSFFFGSVDTIRERGNSGSESIASDEDRGEM